MAGWCNGSTAGSYPADGGSNPSPATTNLTERSTDKKPQHLKINIQKAVRLLTVFFAVLSVALTALVPKAYAAPTVYDPSDYLIGATVNGDIKTAVFEFSGNGIRPAVILRNNGGVVARYSTSYGSFGSSEMLEGWTYMELESAYLGYCYAIGEPCSSGYVVDVRDLSPGSSIDIDVCLSFDISVSGGAITFVVESGFFAFKPSYGYYAKIAERDEYDWSSTGNVSDFLYDVKHSYLLPDGVAYIAPFFRVIVQSERDDDSMSCRIDWSSGVFRMYVDTNMVEEQTALQSAINDKLGDLNDKLDDTNDKLDDIISGGQAGDDLNDALDPSSPFGDASDDLNDAVGDFEDSSSKLPTVPDTLPETDSSLPTAPAPVDPDELPDIPDDLPNTPDNPTSANPDSVDDYVNIAGNFLNWENSGLTYMYAPMVLSVTLAILFYTVFGKA